MRRVTLPRVQPIIPTRRKEPFDDAEWLFEFKYDEFRAPCNIEQGGCRFISGSGNALNRFDALGNHVAATLDVDAIIDGEGAIGRGQRARTVRADVRRYRRQTPGRSVWRA